MCSRLVFFLSKLSRKSAFERASSKTFKGYRGYPQNTHPLCIAAVFKNSPRGNFSKWFWFWTAFERAHKAGNRRRVPFSVSLLSLESPPLLPKYFGGSIETNFSPSTAILFMRAPSNVVRNHTKTYSIPTRTNTKLNERRQQGGKSCKTVRDTKDS